MLPELYPLLLQPALHVKVWGGRKLETVLSKNLPSDEPYGEAWELHDTAVVVNGVLAGQALGELVQDYGTALIGESNDPVAGFPLLAKLLDASQWLSVQVHPNDEQAQRLEGDPRGKTEAWVVLATDPGAQLAIGVEPGTSPDKMAQAIQADALEDLLVFVDVQPGNVLFIAANTIHAIGPGNLLYEIQQSSDMTYRLYDWGRVGLDGQPRTLHINKGIAVSNLDRLPILEHPDDSCAESQLLVDCPFFQTFRHTLHNHHAIDMVTDGRFHAITCIDGEMSVSSVGHSVAFQKGQTVLVPAGLDHFTMTGQGQVLRSCQPPV